MVLTTKGITMFPRYALVLAFLGIALVMIQAEDHADNSLDHKDHSDDHKDHSDDHKDHHDDDHKDHHDDDHKDHSDDHKDHSDDHKDHSDDHKDHSDDHKDHHDDHKDHSDDHKDHSDDHKDHHDDHKDHSDDHKDHKDDHKDHTDDHISSEGDLRQHLFEGQHYDKRIRPIHNAKKAVHSSVSITPIVLRDVDINHHTLTLDTWLTVTWEDEYLKWHPHDFGGIEHLNLPLSEVWSPDFSVYTGISDSNFLPHVQTNVVVRHDGEMTWIPPFSIHNRCPDLSLVAPRVDCVISIISWTYDVTQLDIEIYKKVNESLEHFEDTNPNYHLVSMSATKETKTFSCCPEPYPIIHFLITLEKKYT